jgi:UDP-N-acetylmuramoyl-tripeptide--D-alanyl-D-alanine ligase
MPFSMPLDRIAQSLGALSHDWSATLGQMPITQVTTDSRSLEPGDLFLALRGDRFDGHAFVKQALAQGAIAAVVSDMPSDVAGPLLQVRDTLAAYQQLGTLWRRQFAGPVVAVTGSVGKTTTKELIAAVLETQGPVLKTRANYNNEIGVPKTLLELGSAHHFAVIEMGMRAAGEIALLGQIAEPDIAVITNVGTAHIGRLGSEQAIADAKCELLHELDSAGVAVLNHDNLRLMNTAARVWRGKTITYGLEGGDLHGEWVDAQTLRVDGTLLPLPLPGRHNALNYLAALAVAKVLGLSWQPLTAGLAVELPQGRSRRLDLPNNVVILDETYNAGLESMLAALRLLADTPGSRRIAVLGTMKELGDRSLEFHQQVGAAVRDLGLDALLILADPAEADALATGASGVPTERFATHAEVVDWLRQSVKAGDRLLFKASRAVGLDQVVSQLLAGMQDEGCG